MSSLPFSSRISLFPVLQSRRPRLALTICFALIAFALWLAMPAVAHAQDSITDSPVTKPCSSCHSDEADAWGSSPHASLVDPATGHALATCTTCHGDYVRGHPEEDSVPLVVDSSSCKDCHEETWSQWEVSTHGDKGVQCISCHLVHSQTMRLTDDRLCSSCHRESLEDTMHQAHWEGNATCTDCHMAETTTMSEAVALAGGLLFATHAPDHDFVSVSSAKCLDCHREDAQDTVGGTATTQNISSTNAADSKLAQAQQTNRRLGVLSLANLGFGVGIGGILGIVFMVAYARFGSRRNS